MKKLSIYLLAFSALLAGLQLGLWLMAPERPDTDTSSLRDISQGSLVGFADRENTHAWLGVPFARAPEGELRWKAPRPARPWQGILAATRFASHCTQIANPSVTFNILEWGEVSGAEDCLFLNIWAPAFAKNTVPQGEQRLPVMVWIHGGGNTIGHGASYDGSVLAGSQQVLVVTINYRLGIFGWFSHPALRATSTDGIDASGNYGTLDIIQSLRWVRENIAAFGGDPDNVTVFGESAGGRNTVTVLASPLAKGLFHRAIVQSGSTGSVSVLTAENYTDEQQAGAAGSSSEILLHLLQNDTRATDRSSAKAFVDTQSSQQISDYLRAKSVDDLLSFFPVMDFGMYYAPQIFEDGVVLPPMPLADVFLQADNYNNVPVITGSNRDEAKMFLMNDSRMVDVSFGLFRTVTDSERYELHNRYRSDAWKALAVDQLAERLHGSQGGKVWTYRFDWDEGGDTLLADYAQVMGAAHSLEIPFIFAQYSGLTMPGVFVDDNKESRELLAAQMMSYWAEFAYSGDPGRGRDQQLPLWKGWNRSAYMTLLLDSTADGGLRMASETIAIDALKARLRDDKQIVNKRDRCELYLQMFRGSTALKLGEYRRLPGCDAYPVTAFKPW